MFPYSDEVLAAHLHERQSRLAAEAAAHRLARQAQPEGPAGLDRLLGATGTLLVRWGERLQERSRCPQAATREINPA